MAEKTIAGITLAVNDEGYLEDPGQWTQEIAEEIETEGPVRNCAKELICKQ